MGGARDDDPQERAGPAWLIGVAAAVVAAGLGTALLVRGSAGPAQSELDRAAAADLSTASAELAGAPAVRFTGTFTGAGRQRVAVDARVSATGAVLGTLTVAGRPMELLAASGQTFVRAGREFWLARPAEKPYADEYARRWVLLGPAPFGPDLTALLSPDTYSDALRAASGVTAGPVTTVDGEPATVVDADALSISVTTGQPKRVLRIAARPAPSASPAAPATATVPPSPALPAPPARDLDLAVSHLAPAEADALRADVRRRAAELGTALDGQVHVTVRTRLDPCAQRRCTLTAWATPLVDDGTPYLARRQPVRLELSAQLRARGKVLRTCRSAAAAWPGVAAVLRCEVTNLARGAVVTSLVTALPRATVEPKAADLLRA